MRTSQAQSRVQQGAITITSLIEHKITKTSRHLGLVWTQLLPWRKTSVRMACDLSIHFSPWNNHELTAHEGFASQHEHLDSTNDSDVALRKIRTAGSISITPELFEKLYLSPQNKVKGQLRQTVGNPTPLYVAIYLVHTFSD